MIRFLFPVLLLAFFMHINTLSSAENLDFYELNKSSLSNGTNNCTVSGGTCLNCYTSQLCKWNMTTGVYDEYIFYCKNGSTCSAGACGVYDNPECSTNTTNPEFECRTPGMYPEPLDCQKYHYCVPGTPANSTSNSPLIKYSAECDCHYAYNPFTKSCDLKMGNDTCDTYNSVPPCYEKGQSGILRNPSIYYICLPYHDTGILYPYLYGCDHGKVYNSVTYLCE